MTRKAVELPSDLLVQWLRDEYSYSSQKFGNSQSEALRTKRITDSSVFMGQAAMYWDRMKIFREGGAHLQAAQAAGKMGSSARSLWATLRSIDRPNDLAATDDSLEIIDGHFCETDYHDYKPLMEKDDFWETAIGLGATYLELNIKRTGLDRKFRLGQLMRAEQILCDASAIAALQFEQTIEATGNLPQPGLSSGNIELWLPSHQR